MEDEDNSSLLNNVPISSREELKKGNISIPEPKHLNYYNGQLHLALISGDYDDCKAKASEMETETGGRNVYAKIVRGTIAREEGNLDEAFRWFTQAMQLCPYSLEFAVEVGRIHFLAGRHIEAVVLLEKAMHRNQDNLDSMCCYWLARSLYHTGRKNREVVQKVKDILTLAPNLKSRPELLRLQAGIFIDLNDISSAVAVYRTIIEIEHEESNNYIELGKLLLRMGNEEEGFAMFARALGYTSASPEALLGVGYVMQRNGDHDVALNKYRISAATNVYDGGLWNNIGMCLYAKGKFVSGISCLKKAAYLNPLEYKILYNLGLSHLAMNQYSSSYHFLAASLSLKPNNADILSTLAIVLTRMKDPPNARKAYKKAMEVMENPDIEKMWNYAVFEFNEGELESSKEAVEKLLERLKTPSNNEEEMMRGQTERIAFEIERMIALKNNGNDQS
uniref:Uncharacterized protein n=1 Tax=Pristionchus pacificus TaxID=54126 RepID=A0A8R1V329_PRIPA